MSKQRTIDFRAWDGRHQEWIVNDFFISLANGQIYEGKPAHPRIVLEQFTGVIAELDGKEIYDGDIVHRQGYTKVNGKRRIANGGRVWVVRWTTSRFSNGWNIASGKGVKVLGNIHENPELLKRV